MKGARPAYEPGAHDSASPPPVYRANLYFFIKVEIYEQES